MQYPGSLEFNKEGFPVPMGIGLCATARCNLLCEGCYARFYPKDDEMSRDVIERLISSAMEAGDMVKRKRRNHYLHGIRG